MRLARRSAMGLVAIWRDGFPTRESAGCRGQGRATSTPLLCNRHAVTIGNPRTNTFSLTAFDKQRLEWLAPKFDLELLHDDAKFCTLRQYVGAASIDTPLESAIAHRRLLAEICERAIPWVHFHFSQSCRDSLLNLSDARLSRIAELYARDRDAKRQGAETPLAI